MHSGWTPKLSVGSCRKRFEALQNDGEWQKLFDDHVAERSE